MGEINEAFKEIFFLAKEAMDVREDGMDIEAYAGSLLIFDTLHDKIKKVLKGVKKTIQSKKDLAGQELNQMRLNPNASLEDFAEEMPKSCSIDDREDSEEPNQNSAESPVTSNPWD